MYKPSKMGGLWNCYTHITSKSYDLYKIFRAQSSKGVPALSSSIRLGLPRSSEAANEPVVAVDLRGGAV